jgi:hypothetical protein
LENGQNLEVENSPDLGKDISKLAYLQRIKL